MLSSYIPKGYQTHINDFIQENKRCAIWASMGMGKTVSTITALEDMSLWEDVYPVLVVAPLRVAKTTWPNELSKWEHLNHLRANVVTGTTKQKQQSLREPVEFYTTNFEQLPWLIEQLGEDWPFKTVVIDESTKLKGFRTRQGTKRAKSLAQVAHTKVNRIVLLTGTPSPNGLGDLWGQIWFIDKGQRLGKSFTAFKERWFTTDYNGFGMNALPHAQDQIHKTLGDICLTVDAKDWFDIKEPIVNKIMLDLPPKAANLYRDMEKEMYLELDSGPIEALNAAAKTMKCLQIANGAIYTDDKQNWKLIHDEKVSAIDSIIEESSGMPIIVAYKFKSDLERLQAAYPKGKKMDADPQTITDWNKGLIPLLFLHPASAGHGLNLQDGGNTLVFFSVDWNLEEHLQVIERIGPMRQLQSGHKRPVFLHFLLARNTVDELILERLIEKRSVQDILLDAMNNFKKNLTVKSL